MKFGIILSLLILPMTGSAFAGLSELRYLTSNYLAFVESQWINYQTSPVFEASRRECPETMNAYFEKVMNAAGVREKFLRLEYLRGEYPEEEGDFVRSVTDGLQHFLLRRLNWLQQREAAYQVFKTQVARINAGEGMKIEFVHTVPEMMKKYPPDSLYAPMAQIALMDYTFLNRIIREMYDLVPSNQIAGDIEALLRASPALHRFLLRETSDPGYPEEGFMLDRNSPNTTGDLVHYRRQFVAEERFKVRDLMLGAPSGAENIVYLTLQEAFELKAKTLTGELVSAPALPSIERLLIAKKREETRRRNLAQPPVFFSMPPNVPKKSNPGKKRPTTQGAAVLSSVSASSPLEQIVQTSEEAQEVVVESSAELSTAQEPKVQESTLVEDMPLQEFDRSELEADLDKESVVRKSKTNAPVVPSVAPRFRRVFHSKQGEAEAIVADLGVLKKKRALWLDNLFNRRLKTVRYRDFKKVWLALGGKMGSGQDQNGSHFELMDSRGRVVGGIFAHNEGQEYSSPYHPVLRDAFNMLGVRF